MNLGQECIPPLVSVIKDLPFLNFLDVSATGLNGNHIQHLLSSLSNINCLKSLNLSFNSVRVPGAHILSEKVDNSTQGKVIQTIADFIHFSNMMLHIDLGGMNFHFFELAYIFERGLRKSRTL